MATIQNTTKRRRRVTVRDGLHARPLELVIRPLESIQVSEAVAAQLLELEGLEAPAAKPTKAAKRTRKRSADKPAEEDNG